MAGRNNQDKGRIGERIAEKFLISRGYMILNRNFSTPFGEIDLVAKKGCCIIFLEVKTRVSDNFGPPLSSITWMKRKHIIKNCQYYLRRFGLCEDPCRIDAIGIKLNTRYELEILRHVKNAIEISYKL